MKKIIVFLFCFSCLSSLLHFGCNSACPRCQVVNEKIDCRFVDGGPPEDRVIDLKHNDWISQLVVDDSGKYVLALYQSGKVKVFELTSSKVVAETQLFYPTSALMVGKKVYIGTTHGAVLIFNFTGDQLKYDKIGYYAKPGEAVQSFVVGNGKLIIGTTKGSIAVWDLGLPSSPYLIDPKGVKENRICNTDKDCISKFCIFGECFERKADGHLPEKIWNVALNPEGKVLSCSYDRTCKIWDFSKPEKEIVTETSFFRMSQLKDSDEIWIISRERVAVYDQRLVQKNTWNVFSSFNKCWLVTVPKVAKSGFEVAAIAKCEDNNYLVAERVSDGKQVSVPLEKEAEDFIFSPTRRAVLLFGSDGSFHVQALPGF